MGSLRDRRTWAVAVGSLAVSVGALTTAAPAHADAVTDSFLSALTDAGVGYNDPASAVELGQSVCPLLAEPGGSFAGAASNIADNGISPDMASLFTSIAISMYCPSMMASIANGDWLGEDGLAPVPFDIPGLPRF